MGDTPAATDVDSDQGWVPPVGSTPGWRIRYELVGCALHGHDLSFTGCPGTTAVDDPGLVRYLAGLRWHRCLRCDAWLPIPVDRSARRPPE